jgi:hypothetical protein
MMMMIEICNYELNISILLIIKSFLDGGISILLIIKSFLDGGISILLIIKSFLGGGISILLIINTISNFHLHAVGRAYPSNHANYRPRWRWRLNVNILVVEAERDTQPVRQTGEGFQQAHTDAGMA